MLLMPLVLSAELRLSSVVDSSARSAVILDALASSNARTSTTDPGPFEALHFGSDSTLDIVTWNIEHFPKNAPLTDSLIKAAIVAMDADVIAVQEIDTADAFKAMVDDLEDYDYVLGSGSYAQLGYIYKRTSLALNDAFAIYESEWNAFPRDPLVLDITFQGQDYIVINNHFKCCGDGTLDSNDSSDEEYRRWQANTLLKVYIEEHYADVPVIVVGDFNDVLEDASANNVFQSFIDDSEHFEYADMAISFGSSAYWSYPSWPSDLDHILVSDELFYRYEVETITLDDYLGSWSAYDAALSDHRPVGIRLSSDGDSSYVVDPDAAKHIYMTASDYQIIVDYVNEAAALNNSHEHPENSENYYGASAYYSNFDIRSGSYSSAFASYEEAITSALSEVFLPAYVSDVALNAVFIIHYATYDGNEGSGRMTLYCSSVDPLVFSTENPLSNDAAGRASDPLQVLPNPVLQGFRLNADLDQLSVTDLSGRVMWHQGAFKSGETVEVSTWPSGLYFLYALRGQDVQVLSFIKK